jgi:hypothetical protein
MHPMRRRLAIPQSTMGNESRQIDSDLESYDLSHFGRGGEVAIFPALEAADTLVADIRASFRSIERPGVEAA